MGTEHKWFSALATSPGANLVNQGFLELSAIDKTGSLLGLFINSRKTSIYPQLPGRAIERIFGICDRAKCSIKISIDILLVFTTKIIVTSERASSCWLLYGRTTFVRVGGKKKNRLFFRFSKEWRRKLRYQRFLGKNQRKRLKEKDTTKAIGRKK